MQARAKNPRLRLWIVDREAADKWVRGLNPNPSYRYRNLARRKRIPYQGIPQPQDCFAGRHTTRSDQHPLFLAMDHAGNVHTLLITLISSFVLNLRLINRSLWQEFTAIEQYYSLYSDITLASTCVTTMYLYWAKLHSRTDDHFQAVSCLCIDDQRRPTICFPLFPALHPPSS